MKTIRMTIKKLNLVFVSILMLIFYICIIPLGKIILYIHSFFTKQNRDSYWVPMPFEKVDTSSPY